MNSILLAGTILLALITLYVAIRTIIETRRRYYNDDIKSIKRGTNETAPDSDMRPKKEG